MIRRPPRSTLSLHDALPIFHTLAEDLLTLNPNGLRIPTLDTSSASSVSSFLPGCGAKVQNVKTTSAPAAPKRSTASHNSDSEKTYKNRTEYFLHRKKDLAEANNCVSPVTLNLAKVSIVHNVPLNLDGVIKEVIKNPDFVSSQELVKLKIVETRMPFTATSGKGVFFAKEHTTGRETCVLHGSSHHTSLCRALVFAAEKDPTNYNLPFMLN
jgi:hypothetical protein